MNLSKTLIFNFLNLFIGLSFSLGFLEIIAKILPSMELMPLETPIECPNLDVINLNCLHRRAQYISGRITKGKFPPFEVDAIKKSNDIGQFTDIDMSSFINNDKKKFRVLTIGDSQVEALQVDNNETFHGLLNNKNFISTSIGSAGMAFPNYVQSLRFFLNKTNLNKDYLIFSIQPNDFDESFEEYGIKGRRAGRGQFFFREDEKIIFKDFPTNNSAENLISLTLKNSSLARYFTYNLPLLQRIKTLKAYCLINKNVSQCDTKSYNHAANVIDESYESNPERYKIGFKATDIFLKNLSNLTSENPPKNIILLIDADRGYIKGKYPNKGVYFEAQRNYLIDQAKNYNFSVINLEEKFEEKYKSGSKLNSSVDGHWDESGHKAAYEEIILSLNKLIK